MKYTYYFLILVFIVACGQSDAPKGTTDARDNSTKKTGSSTEVTQEGHVYRVDEYNMEFDPVSAKKVLNIDLDQKIDDKNLEEIRILKNSLYARQGYIFNKAELRGYFSTFQWYDSLVSARWELDEMIEGGIPLHFTPEEEDFIDKLEDREEVLLEQNYKADNGIVNVGNIINNFQFTGLSEKFYSQLGKKGFAIVPNNNIQFFHLYEQNDYQQIPNFVTTDLFLQLYHMYFSYLLRNIEKEIFYGRITDISGALYKQAISDYKSKKDEQTKDAALHNAIFFAVANKILGNQDEPLPGDLQNIVDEEYKKVMAARDDFSEYLGYSNIEFPYSLFKPRGHYSRSDVLKNYFRAMMWLQKGEMCLDSDKSLRNAIYMAHLLKKTKHNDKSVYDIFLSVYEPVKFIIGEPDNLSIQDVINNMPDEDEMFSPDEMASLREDLQKLDRDKIKPKQQRSCPNKINLMPQRFCLDNEALQELVDTDTGPETKRGMPKGIDVFGMLGVKQADKLLYEFYDEDGNWGDFDPRYKKLQDKYESFDEWDNSVYSKWLECLSVMQNSDDDQPYFMLTDGWEKKNLNTALASWAELKHDAILYAEQPMGAECGGGGPPPPVTMGYVEPNITFWSKMIELINLTEKTLKDNDLMLNELENVSTQIRDLAQFLKQVTEKELNGEKLNNDEYNTIEVIGSSVEYMTISLLDNPVDDWSQVKGPDREVAIVADVYTANADNNPQQGIMHVAVGPVNDIYVVVEIEGYLYLSRGATFSYYEFTEPMDSRLTDEEWQDRIHKSSVPDIPEWMKEIIFYETPPKPNEKIFYSSGC